MRGSKKLDRHRARLSRYGCSCCRNMRSGGSRARSQCGKQLGSNGRCMVNCDRRYAKRQHHKARRRAERQLGEDAPKKNRYRGWVD